jgi:hypothetical protein
MVFASLLTLGTRGTAEEQRLPVGSHSAPAHYNCNVQIRKVKYLPSSILAAQSEEDRGSLPKAEINPCGTPPAARHSLAITRLTGPGYRRDR